MGTGLLGIELKKLGYTQIEGVDASDVMLDVARESDHGGWSALTSNDRRGWLQRVCHKCCGTLKTMLKLDHW